MSAAEELACSCRRLTVAALLAAVSACAAEPPPPAETADRPGGWATRMDSDRSDPGEFRLSDEVTSLRVTTGPAGIAWREEDAVASGDFRVEGTFEVSMAPVGYREAFGIFVGGRDLDLPDQEYTYLLVRPTGDLLIKRRVGDITETLVDWTPHDAVARVVQFGDAPVNVLAVEVGDGETRFLVNGQVVHAMSAAEARPYGIAGVRVNHRLDLRMTGWVVETLADES